MKHLSSTLLGALAALIVCANAGADLNLKEGRWRLELNQDFGVYQGSRDRSGDYSVNGTVEYEVPAGSRLTLGLRLMPLFAYTQNSDRGNRLFRHAFKRGGEDGDTVWGGGLGLGIRIYQIKDEYRGWFGEAGVTALAHDNKFIANSSNLNFVNTLGVGYQFQNDWHVQFHYQHISNASLGKRNAGANSLGFGLGYRF